MKGLSQKAAPKKVKNNGSRLLRKSRLSAYNLVVKTNHKQVAYSLYETGRQLIKQRESAQSVLSKRVILFLQHTY